MLVARTPYTPSFQSRLTTRVTGAAARGGVRVLAINSLSAHSVAADVPPYLIKASSGKRTSSRRPVYVPRARSYRWLLCSAGCLLLHLHIALASDTGVRALKEWLSNPPPIQSMVFELQEYPELFPPGTSKVGGYYVTVRPNPTYRASWQANAFVFVETNATPIEILDGKTRLTVDSAWLCGFYSNSVTGSNVCWYVKPDDQLTYYFNRLELRPNGVWLHDLLYDKRSLLYDVLGLGVAHLVPGSVVWSGLHFTGTNVSGSRVLGVLSTNALDGLPMTIHYTVDGLSGNWSVGLNYDGTRAWRAGLPTGFERRYMPDSHSTTNQVLEAVANVLSLQEVGGALAYTHFQEEIGFKERVRRVYILENGRLTYQEDGKVMSVTNKNALMVSSPNRNSKLPLYVAFVLLSFGPLVFLAHRHWKKQRTQT